jgi:hypothetical protein
VIFSPRDAAKSPNIRRLNMSEGGSPIELLPEDVPGHDRTNYLHDRARTAPRS